MKSDSKIYTILLVDDHELFSESLSYVIEYSVPDFNVIGKATSGTEAVKMVDTLSPDLVLMDIRMPEMDGLAATRAIHRAFPEVKVVILTAFEDEEFTMKAIHSGAKGYLMKSLTPIDLLESLRLIMRGASIFSDRVVSTIVHDDDPAEPFEWAIQSLSPREREVLKLLMDLQSNQEIADRMHLSKHSVRNYVSSIYAAFGINERFDLVRKLRALNDTNGLS